MSETPTLHWKDNSGLETIKIIVQRCTSFANRLYSYQLPLIAKILDGEDVLCITATGDGKSALFAIPLVILHEYNTNYHLYPQGFPTRAHPFGIVITPTKGLANTFVRFYFEIRFDVTSCESRYISSKETSASPEWDLICLDPEHLTGKDWHAITDCEFFLSNLLQCTIDEVHLVDEWGRDFQIAFRIIGKFIRGRFPTHVSIVGLTATLLPGSPTTSICKSLGFYRNGFTLVRRSNKQPNMQL
ncbi:P-loop containing nucleoside triphosphate hydrolase protein, partial [Dendrothele bispora CBS 962.96]